MSHYDKIPDLLANLVASPSIAEACRRTGMTPATHWNYLIRSKQGDPLFQEIEWHGVKAPYWQHVANTRVLAAAAIEQAALDRALNGCWVPSYFKGEPVFETNEQFLGWTDEEMRALDYDPVRDRFVWEGDPPRRKQVMVWLKPSEQLAIRMLESWHKRYRPPRRGEAFLNTFDVASHAFGVSHNFHSISRFLIRHGKINVGCWKAQTGNRLFALRRMDLGNVAAGERNDCRLAPVSDVGFYQNSSACSLCFRQSTGKIVDFVAGHFVSIGIWKMSIGS